MSTITEKVTYGQFIFLGDSITQMDCNPEVGFSCYGALQFDYIRRVDIVNRGFSGYNTSNALTILPRIFPTPTQAPVRLLTIFFGANDAASPNSLGTHVPLPQYKVNLFALATHTLVRAHPKIKILFVTPPPIDEWQFDEWDEPGKSARKAVAAREYADAVKEVGNDLGIAVADLWGGIMRETDWNGGPDLPGTRSVPKSDGLARLLYDGLHLGGEGFKILYRVIKKAIADAYPELTPQRLPIALEPFYPEWYK